MTTPPPPPTDHRATTREARFPRARRFVAARLDPKAYLGLHATIGLLGASLALWLFGALLDAVLDDATLVHWDMATAAAVHGRATPAGLAIFDAVTQIGSPLVVGILGVVGCVVLWRVGHRTTLVAWIATFAGAGLLDQVLKLSVHRSRPQYGAAYLHGHSYSFPSGHAMGSTAAYGILAWALVGLWPPARAHRRLVHALAILVVAAVGVSRVYLGVHYPSDVVGGWAAGGAWLAICVTGAGIARRRAEAMAATSHATQSPGARTTVA